VLKFENVGLKIALLTRVHYLIYFESKETMRSNLGNEIKQEK